ncbi:alpha/beta fold hydrolase [Bordetella sp. FB-8]|uniref:alpha/beta fold hydrolase n=1 Tax=Bordetella sp. FB-8 TaxID=1159870 RepID=UPI00036D78FE|nr:alpha/beta hydrolase [Bordetella sp. FB-8]
MTAPLASRDQWIDHPRGRIFARRWRAQDASDAAPPIVLLHDSLGSVELWRDFPAALSQAAGREVIAYDRLGFGRSEARHPWPSLDFVREEATEVFPVLLAQLGARKCVVMGHSVGGGMAIECAAQFPDRCSGLVTIAAQVFPEDRTLAGIRAAREQFREPGQMERLARYHGDKAQWVLDAWTEIWLDPAFASWSLATVLARVRCPALAIHGQDDEYGSTIHTDLMARHSGGPVRRAILPGVGHMPHREQPDQVLRLVADFLAAEKSA